MDLLRFMHGLKLCLLRVKQQWILWFVVSIIFVLSACDKAALNSPQPIELYSKNIRFGSFSESPKTLDPAQSYSVDEIQIIAQIYEPPLQYHLLKRPFQLVPLTTTSMPLVRFWDKQGHEVITANKNTSIAFTTYDIHIQPHIFYQPHPAFAKDKEGHYLYQTPSFAFEKFSKLSDFKNTGTRELTAEDYIYEIKRLAHPAVNSPILGVMENHIYGLEDYAKLLQTEYKKFNDVSNNHYFDLRKYPLPGVQLLDKYSYRIIISGNYQQFKFWLATNFFAPVPWEADYFYSLPELKKHNITFDWYPLGTGPYMLTENNPNKQMVLTRNPNFRVEYFPHEGEAQDVAAGFLDNAGKKLPFVDQFIFSLEKEAIPRWNKFLQGYYDQSGISSDNFGEAIQVNPAGKISLTPALKAKNITLRTAVQPAIYYYGFNMLDPVVGGSSERARKLRQAIALAINIEDLITIFLNQRGIPAQGPIPPGIFGFTPDSINPFVYETINGKLQRRSLQYAKQLLAEAGYPNGRDAQTGKPLVIRYDAIASQDNTQNEWMRQQFKKLGIELNIETTDANRYQDKVRKGDIQFFPYAWLADYPDPENFLFLFYSKNAQVKYGGVNFSNYSNPDFDELFDQMRVLADGPERQLVIDKMVAILRNDSPWVFGLYPKEYMLSQSWLSPIKPNPVANNILKYQKIDPALRMQKIHKWNQPIFWPLLLILGILIAILLPVMLGYWKKIHKTIFG